MTEIQELREIVQTQAERVTVLTRLVERMGADLATALGARNSYTVIGHYTVISQREYDAAMHEAEGPPPTRESEGAWGYE